MFLLCFHRFLFGFVSFRFVLFFFFLLLTCQLYFNALMCLATISPNLICFSLVFYFSVNNRKAQQSHCVYFATFTMNKSPSFVFVLHFVSFLILNELQDSLKMCSLFDFIEFRLKDSVNNKSKQIKTSMLNFMLWIQIGFISFSSSSVYWKTISKWSILFVCLFICLYVSDEVP